MIFNPVTKNKIELVSKLLDLARKLEFINQIEVIDI